MRRYTLLDRLLATADRGLKVLTSQHSAQRPMPGARESGDSALSAEEKSYAARLMRVNHAGEIAAQGLYHGQLLTACNTSTRKQLEQAAHEEADHLAWCEKRIGELGGRTSLLTPLWYTGAVSIGAVAGLFGDNYSLGFVKETEDQVVEHLEAHCAQVSPHDRKTTAIIRQIQADEAEHAEQARRAGSTDMPAPVRHAMRMMAKVMTSVTHYL